MATTTTSTHRGPGGRFAPKPVPGRLVSTTTRLAKAVKDPNPSDLGEIAEETKVSTAVKPIRTVDDSSKPALELEAAVLGLDSTFLNKSGKSFTETPGEISRTYVYGPGDEVTIREVRQFRRTKSGSHLLYTQDGRSYVIRDGWRTMSWEVEKGAVNFPKIGSCG